MQFPYPEDWYPPELATPILELVPHQVWALRWLHKHAAKYPEKTSDFDLCRSIITSRRLFDMSTSRKSKSTKSAPRVRDDSREVSWVNVSLSDDDVNWIDENLPGEVEVAMALLSLAKVSVNLYVRFMPDSEAFTAGMIGENPNSPGSLLGLSGWSSDVYDAVRALAGKWYSTLGGQWSNAPEPKPRRFR
jgi:hypothetical protein